MNRIGLEPISYHMQQQGCKAQGSRRARQQGSRAAGQQDSRTARLFTRQKQPGVMLTEIWSIESGSGG